MLRFIRYLVLAALVIVLLVMALANRALVTLRLMPEGIGTYFGITWRIDMPLFLVILGGVVAGLLIGFLWEWMREHKHRAGMRRARREAARLEREAQRSGIARHNEGDDILAIADRPRKAG